MVKAEDAGIAGPVIFVILFMAAVANFPGYTITHNYLSDLGVPPASGWFFNTGLIVSGLLGFVFAYSLRGFDKPGAMLLMTGSLFLTLVSIFTLNAQPMHSVFAGIFFLTTAAGFVFIASELRSRTKLWLLPAATTIVSILFVLAQTPLVEHGAVAMINLTLFSLSLYFRK